MPSVGKLIASLFSAANENTLALASLKFDFSLMKVEAPAEFSGLGEALSTRRRHEAEDGTHHRTARRLAALFEQLIPCCPNLITAYGLRCSEIMRVPGVNPKASPQDGPFEPFVGADGTAMWAAATSGVPALGVYLLACLLARAWDAKEATSIWVELVGRRRQAIEGGIKTNHSLSDSSRMSIHQQVSRDDLAQWDASARAWLRSADQAKVREQTQLMLVIKNVQLPFNSGVSTYDKVIETLRQAMRGLNDLVSGKPQEIFNGAILLAFSAWHIYPNLIVLGGEIKTIQFDDQRVDPRGTGTIRLHPRSTSQGTSWSLALSHLRYYGDSVTVKSSTDFSRVDIHELHIIALGSIFNSWEINRRDIFYVAQWFSRLWDFLCRDASRAALDGLDWFQCLAEAAKEVVKSEANAGSGTMHLLNYGQRRGKRFLGAPEETLEPFFGLASEAILAGLSKEDDEERGVAFLRTAAKEYGWRCSDAYISSEQQALADYPFISRQVFMTAVPHTCRSKKRDVDGNLQKESAHARWVHFEEIPFTQTPNSHVRSVLSEQIRELSKHGERTMRIRNAPCVSHRESIWGGCTVPV